jgi:hypothetical protein
MLAAGEEPQVRSDCVFISKQSMGKLGMRCHNSFPEEAPVAALARRNPRFPTTPRLVKKDLPDEF